MKKIIIIYRLTNKLIDQLTDSPIYRFTDLPIQRLKLQIQNSSCKLRLPRLRN